MSWNSIYQITTEPMPLGDYMRESDFHGSPFISDICDYLDDVNVGGYRDRIHVFAADILTRCGNCVEVETTFPDDGYPILSFTFKDGFKQEYFRNRFAKFQKEAERIARTSFEDFCEEGVSTYHLVNYICEEYETYIVPGDDADSYIEMDTFIREAVAGRRYYVGGIVNYHY